MADQVEARKRAKYAELATTHHFVALAVKTSGVFGSEAQMFFCELGRRIKDERTLFIDRIQVWLQVCEKWCSSRIHRVR